MEMRRNHNDLNCGSHRTVLTTNCFIHDLKQVHGLVHVYLEIILVGAGELCSVVESWPSTQKPWVPSSGPPTPPLGSYCKITATAHFQNETKYFI